MYYLFVAKDLHITAYIGKKINNTIAKCNIKLVREINSYRVCYTDTLINLNVVTIYKLGDSELIYKFIEDQSKKLNKKTQSFNDWLNNLGKEGYKLVHCEYLISEKGKLCILKRK